MIVLRPYQEKFIADIRSALSKSRRVLGVMPTGAGKTICFAYITSGALAKGKRILILVHRGIILDQISNALNEFSVPHGRIQPGWPTSTESVQIGMIQTTANRWKSYSPFDMIVVDECHHAVSPTYSKLLENYPEAYVLGVTATPERLDGHGLGNHFSEMVLGPEIPWLIDNGYLADYYYYAPPTKLDISKIKKVNGDYALDELEVAVDKKHITGDAIGHYRDLADGKPAIVFCVGVNHARHVAEAFAEVGYRSESIDGTMTEIERRQRLHGLADGSLQILTSCMLIGEGVDVPAVAAIIHLRPTKSLALKKQFDGRGLRIKLDGGKAIILDHVGNFEEHGTPRTVHEWVLDNKIRKPTKAGIRQCKHCYRVFAPREIEPCDSESPDCLMKPKENPPEIATVNGYLVPVDDSDFPAWTRGISLIRAHGREWKTLISRAQTFEQLRAIALARGYKIGWIYHVMKKRRENQNRKNQGYHENRRASL